MVQNRPLIFVMVENRPQISVVVENRLLISVMVTFCQMFKKLDRELISFSEKKGTIFFKRVDF